MKKNIYLDNAATTPLDSGVLEVMMPYLSNHFGNPSSTHSHGRKAKSAIEKARKTVAQILNVSPGDICFTSGGTEADNLVLFQSVEHLGIKHIVSSRLEHHAVLHSLEYLENQGKIKVSFLENDEKGVLNLDLLPDLLKKESNSLVSLMHGNNEIGNLNDLEAIGRIAHENGAVFHSDTVQSMAHFPFDLQKLPVDYIVASAHKFYGPKGVGFLCTNSKHKLTPMLHGGGQERNLRSGTENVPGIVGLVKALELINESQAEHRERIKRLKTKMIRLLREKIPGVSFNGLSDDLENSLYTVLNVSFPNHPNNEMLLFNLDIEGISASGGSACSSGANQGSHVLRALNVEENRANVRFSFGKFNTEEDVEEAVRVLEKLFSTAGL